MSFICILFMDKTMYVGIGLICVIAIALLLLETVTAGDSTDEIAGPAGRYSFVAVQTTSRPKAEFRGFLSLSKTGRPVQLKYTLFVDGERRGTYDYAVGQSCKLDRRSGASIFDDLRPTGSTNPDIDVSLKVSPDGKMFLIRMDNPPAPWKYSHKFLAINVKNVQGHKDWEVLPPIRLCAS